MPEQCYLKIEAALTEEEMAVMDQWASNVTEGIRNSDVTFSATYIVLAKLWDRFNADDVDEWCKSLVQAKLQAKAK